MNTKSTSTNRFRLASSCRSGNVLDTRWRLILFSISFVLFAPLLSYGQYWDLFYNNRVLSNDSGRLIRSFPKWNALRKSDQKAIRTVKVIGGIKSIFRDYDSVLETHSYSKKGIRTKASTSENMLSRYGSSCNDSFYNEAYTAQSNISYTDSVTWGEVLKGQWGRCERNLKYLYEYIGFNMLMDKASVTLLPVDSLLNLLDVSINYQKRTSYESIRSDKLLGYYDSNRVLRRFEGNLNHIKIFGSTNRIGPSSYISCLYNKYVIEFDVSYYKTGIDRIVFSFPGYNEAASMMSKNPEKIVDFYTMDIYKKHEVVKAILHMAEGFDNTSGFYTLFYIPKPFVKGSAVRFLQKYPGNLGDGIIKTTF